MGAYDKTHLWKHITKLIWFLCHFGTTDWLFRTKANIEKVVKMYDSTTIFDSTSSVDDGQSSGVNFGTKPKYIIQEYPDDKKLVGNDIIQQSRRMKLMTTLL